MTQKDNTPRQDPYNSSDASSMSDAELERLMGGAMGSSETQISYENLEPGTRLQGTVVEVKARDILVELDGKNFGVVDLEEYEDTEPPGLGAVIDVELVQYDREKDLCVLTTKAFRTEVVWDALRVGQLLEGSVSETNKGGLTLDIKGLRAFMPISQIELERVEDLEKYVGSKMKCEVVQVDRQEENLVVSRRAVLEKGREAQRKQSLQKLKPGDVIKGKITRLTEHGAFVDLGGIDGLLHASKISEQLKSKPGKESLKVGDVIEVEINHVDRDRARIGLDFRAVDENAWDTIIQNYQVGEDVTGWISRSEKDCAILSLEKGLEALISGTELSGSGYSVGAIVQGTIDAIDHEKQEITVRPLPPDTGQA